MNKCINEHFIVYIYDIIEFVNKIPETSNSKLYKASRGIIITTNFNYPLGISTNMKIHTLKLCIILQLFDFKKIHHWNILLT